jgi:hypothetical protein
MIEALRHSLGMCGEAQNIFTSGVAFSSFSYIYYNLKVMVKVSHEVPRMSVR